MIDDSDLDAATSIIAAYERGEFKIGEEQDG
jgi:hypothetical protein